MREGSAIRSRGPRPEVVTVASHAVAFDQLLVKGNLQAALRQRRAEGSAQADVGDGMAGFAACRRSTPPRRVAGKTVRSQRAVTLDQRARADHQMRVVENQRDQAREIQRDDQ